MKHTVPTSRSRIHRLSKLTRRLSSRGFIIPVALINLIILSVIAASSKSPLNQSARTVPTSGRATGQYRTPTHTTYKLTELQQDVRNVTRATYNAYLHACKGRDEFDPYTNTCHDWFNVGLTAIDSLDTLLLLQLTDEYEASRAWAASSLSFANMPATVSVFELVIRGLAGLNSAYALTNDTLWRDRAIDLGEAILPTFNLTKTGCPPMNAQVRPPSLRQRHPNGTLLKSGGMEDDDDYYLAGSSPADAGTLQLEMRTVSKLANDSRFADAADKCMRHMLAGVPSDKLVPPSFNVDTGSYVGSRQTIGGSVDSFYEMMAKTWIGFGKRETDASMMETFVNMVDVVHGRLRGVSKKGLVYIGEKRGRGELRKQMDHLSCFLPGVMAVAALHGLGGGRYGTSETDFIPRARQLARTCYYMTRGLPHGLAGEITTFREDVAKPQMGHDNGYLRPEIVESLYYLDKIDPQAGNTYKKWGKDMWQSIRENAQAPGRPDGVLCSWSNLLEHNGKKTPGGKLDSFVIAETFKYFFLLFDERPLEDSPIPLDKWVFNTEAHPVRISS